MTNELLEQNNKDLASNTFDNSETVLFDGSVEAFYPGGGHTVDNIVVWLPGSKILFGGCFIRSLNSKSLGYTGEAVVNEWPDAVERGLTRYSEAEIVVPGHGEAGGLTWWNILKFWLSLPLQMKPIVNDCFATTDSTGNSAPVSMTVSGH